MTEERRHVWNVRISLPITEWRKYKENKNLTVLADSLERAIALVHEHYPGCDIWNVSHRGGETLIVDVIGGGDG